MTLPKPTRHRARAVVDWYGERVHAHPVITLTISGAIWGAVLFLSGVSISVALDEDPIPWAWYVRVAMIQTLVWLVAALAIRRRAS
ncbi:hypothetical protein ABT158_17325 [Nonomuraea sp. NPDC001636]|uniref:hypothetical protein n=1 Tax=Nonomuraea sp. NPDC001636 TaxID=3154391 RepID=UPI00331FF484